MKLVLYFVLSIICILAVLILIAVVRTLLIPGKVAEWEPKTEPEREKTYSEKLSKMVQYETVSLNDDIRHERFLGFHNLLEKLFPLVHEKLEKTEIDGNLIFYWKGKCSDKPVVLMGHQDVVPAEGAWDKDPFSGEISDGKIWGRGSADTKCSVMAFLQATEELLEEGFVPEQDVYLTSSCTEEVAGKGGPTIVEELKRRGVKPYLVCDEGGAIISEPVGGIKGYYAMIGVMEKGQGNLIVSAKSNGGHSSYPSKNSPIARLAAFETELEKHNPMKSAFSRETETMFKILSAYSPFAYKLLFGNLWLFKPLLVKVMPSISPQAGALLRTTIAFTMQSGSDACNVLPQEATLNINLRYIHHQGMKESNEIIKKIAEKYDLSVTEYNCYDAFEPVDIGSDAYHLVEETIQEVFPKLPTCPYVMTGGTDARFYQEICDACIRFSPVVYGPAQMKGMHGLNECVDGFSLPGAVDFYKTVIKKNK